MTIILLIYGLIGCLYLWVTPPLEASDEYKHYPVVHYIQHNQRLVVVDPENPGRWRQEGVQPPLYYILMAVLTRNIDTSDFDQLYQRNLNAFIGNTDQIFNKNLMFHTPENESLSAGGTVRAIRVIRLASLVLGVGTICFAGLLGRLLFGDEVGWLAAALTAFNPMFLFTSAAVNNDSLANLLGAAGIYALVLLWQTINQGVYRKRALLLGLILGLGMLTKLSLGGLLGVAGLMTLAKFWQTRRWHILFDGILIAGITCLFAAPLLWRNWTLYQDITALNVFVAIQGVRPNAMVWQDWVAEFGTLYRTFWGLFGGVNIATPQAFYYICNGLVLLAVAGWVRAWRQLKSDYVWPALWFLVVFVLLVNWTIIYYSFQGRLLFPALTAFNVLWAAGLWCVFDSAWLGRWVSAQRAFQMLAAGLAICSALFALFVIRPVYALPEPVVQVPNSAEFDPIIYSAPDGGAIALVGVNIADGQSVTPGGKEPFKVTLYWQSQVPVAADYLTAVHLLGRDFVSVAQINRSPASGMIPTSRWRAGEIYQDDYYLFVGQDAIAPNRLRVKVGLFDTTTMRDLPAQTADGQPLELVLVGDGRLAAERVPEHDPAVLLGLEFEQGIELVGYDWPQDAQAGTAVPLTLTWQASATPQADYTVFVQLLSADSELLASGDAPPVTTPNSADNYPTRLWQAGDVIADTHTLLIPADLPAGTYQIAVGFYDPVSGVRVLLKSGQDAAILTVNTAKSP